MKEGAIRTALIALCASAALILSVAVAATAAYAGHDEELRKAARAGDVESARRALAHGADVNGEGKGRFAGTALMHAAGRGHSDVVTLLIERGADVNATAGPWKRTALMEAALGGAEEAARILIENGADVNGEGGGRFAEKALMHAAGRGHSDVVILLIEKGADVNARDRDGATALMDAALGGAEEAARILIENGADVNSRGKEGGTPLMAAALPSLWTDPVEGRLGVARILIEEGADVNAKNGGRWPNLLRTAAMKRHPIVLKDLTQTPGAGFEGKKSDGWTALMYAARVRNVKMVELLIENGADLDIRDNKGRTARDIARELGAEEIAAMLEEAGDGAAGNPDARKKNERGARSPEIGASSSTN